MDSVLTPTKQIHWISKSGENGIKNNHFLGTLFSLFEKCGFKKLPVKQLFLRQYNEHNSRCKNSGMSSILLVPVIYTTYSLKN